MSPQTLSDCSECVSARSVVRFNLEPQSGCRLWQSQEKRHEACALLTAVYGWFNEGFDTADLKAAKVLLDDLQQPTP